MKPAPATSLKSRSKVLPIVLPLVWVAVTTAVLKTLDILFLDTENLIFGYLVPTTLVAIAYGSTAGTFTAIISALAGAYFIYPPTFTVFVDDRLHAMEILLFAVMALAASHIVSRMGPWRRPD